MKKRLLTIGIGGGGINIIHNLFRRKLVDSDFLAIDTDLQSLEPCIAGEKILLGERGLGFNSLGDDLYEYLEKLKQTLTEKVSGYRKVVVISCLGGNTGSKVTPYVLEMFREISVSHFVICTQPFNYESKQKCDLAMDSLRKINNLDSKKYILKNTDLLNLNSHYTILEMFGIQSEEIAMAIKAFNT